MFMETYSFYNSVEQVIDRTETAVVVWYGVVRARETKAMKLPFFFFLHFVNETKVRLFSSLIPLG